MLRDAVRYGKISFPSFPSIRAVKSHTPLITRALLTVSIAIALTGCKKPAPSHAQIQPQDPVKALISSAENGDVEAQITLAMRYHKREIPGDAFDEIFWYLKVMDEGSPDAQIKLLRLLAEDGDAEAQCELGKRYAEGVGIQKDLDNALAWLLRSAKAGNNKGAQLWMKLGADHGIAEAEASLALAYKKGLGVPWNEAEAARWAAKAARKGEPRGQIVLGQTHLRIDAFLAYVWLSAGVAKLANGDSLAEEARRDIRMLLSEPALMRRLTRAQELSTEVFNGKYDAEELQDKPAIPKESATGKSESGAAGANKPQVPTGVVFRDGMFRVEQGNSSVSATKPQEPSQFGRFAKYLVIVNGDKGSGSGALVNLKKNTLIVTNAHVISGNEKY